jgi:hypothetical protein
MTNHQVRKKKLKIVKEKFEKNMEVTQKNLDYDKEYKEMFKDEEIEELIRKEEIEQK